MNYRKLSFMLLAFAITATFFSCSKHPGFKKTADGLYYKFHIKSDDSTTVRTGMIAKVLMKYSINDSVLFNSADMPDEFLLPIDSSQYKGDIYDMLRMMHPGDSATFISSADSFFIKTIRMPEVPDSTYKGANIVFDIKMFEAFTQEQMEAKRQDELVKMKQEEDTKLAAYLQTNNITVSPLESGLYYIEQTKGSGKKPAPGDFASVHFKVANADGQVYYSSYDQNKPMDWEAGKMFDNEGATQALNMMSKGEKTMVIVPSHLGFGEQGRGKMVAPYTTLVYEFEMLDFVTKKQHEAKLEAERKQAEEAVNNAKNEEAGKLQSYIQKNNITVKPTASGLYYIEKVAGTGDQAASGKTVKVHYTGTLLDGTKFDSSVDRGEPFEFTLGQGQVIAGWDEGIALMKVGGKARLVIPSAIAYGPNGRGPSIPPSAPLVFDVELLEVK